MTLAGWPRRALVALALATAGAATASAQDSVVVIRPDLPDDSLDVGQLAPEVVRQLIAIYNDSLTTRIAGSFTLPAGSSHRGRIAVYRGSLRVLGRIEGAVTVINGDLIVGPGGAVVGPAIVAGGRIDVREGGTHQGEATVYEPIAPVTRMPNGLLAIRERRRPLGELAAARTSFQTGSIKTSLNLETGRTYNRVEGLPIVVGASFQTEGDAPADARVDLRAIVRPTSDRTKLRDDVGFTAGTEWRGGGSRRWFGFGARGYRQILSIEDQPLAKGEAGWSAFLFQRDYRDHYEARGIEAFGWLEPASKL
ncbi:MAG: polymer-forming cytoskeletal protein, partial [Gemmatimonadetes bacterium]|nr:polymer-forming cytoskeletal protein [Gemmatimonadota bacterium]